MKITVRVEVEVEGAGVGSHPTRLGWQHVAEGGDNPRFYGHGVQQALTDAAATAIAGAGLYVDYRPQGWKP